jgi:hypothetical protein
MPFVQADWDKTTDRMDEMDVGQGNGRATPS